MNDLDLSTSPNGSTIETALTTLQPIRDLAKNWDIDIAACLDEYLQDLELSLTQETREHVLSSLNFAQAAIVLQNSSGIYSRKVDYLHSYVYKVQEELNANDAVHGSKRGRKSATGVDADIEAFLQYDPHQDFLLLDDVLPIDTPDGAKINLTEAATGGDGSTDYLNASTATTRLSMGHHSHRRASWDSSSLLDHSMTRTNVAAQRALFGTLDAGTLHLVGGACDIGSDGVLRIPGSELFATHTETITDTRDEQDIDMNDNDSFGGGDDMDDDGVGFVLADSDDTSMTNAPSSTDQPTERGKRVTFAAVPALSQAPDATRKPKVDYWAMLDPHVPDDKPERPLRIGKTLVLPDGVDKLPSQYVRGAAGGTGLLGRHRERRQRSHQGYSSRITETFQATLGKRTLDSRSQSVSGLAFGNEFAYIAKETAKRKAEERRALHRQQLLERTGPDPILEEGVVDDQREDAFDFGFGDYDDGDDNGDDNVAGLAGSNTGMATVDEVFHDADDDTNGETKTFEELCRAHIQAFARGAEKYAAETKLSARVEQWQAKLLPLLDDEDQRPEFDIHQYGIGVVRSLEQSLARRKTLSDIQKPIHDEAVEFRDITRDCPQYDVCRKFLAALSLTNSGNIEFAASSTLESLQVNLLNSEIERPMETYLVHEP